MSPQPAPARCAEREKIAESIRAVIGEILALHYADAKGDLDKMESIDKELEEAQAREAFLLDKLHAHVQSHGCNGLRVMQ